MKEGLKITVGDITVQNMNKVHAALHESLQNVISFITLSEHGVYFSDGKEQN